MHKSQHAFPTSSFILRALIVSSDRGILAIFRFAGCGLMSSFSIFFMLFHLCCTSLLVRKSVGERRKSCGEKKKRTTKLWIKRRKRGDESARTVGATILTLAAARAEKKKNQRGWKSGPSAPGDRSSELRRSLQRSASVIYIYIYIYTSCIYYILDLFRPPDLSRRRRFPCSASGFLCEIVRVIAWQLYRWRLKCETVDSFSGTCQICCQPAFHFSTYESLSGLTKV